MMHIFVTAGQVLDFSDHNIIPKLKFRWWPSSTVLLKTFYSQKTNVNSCKVSNIKSIIMIGELKRTAEEVDAVYFKILSMNSCGMTDNK
jgi:hypothetical protein